MESKSIILWVLGLVGSFLLTIFFKFWNFDFKDFQNKDWVLIIMVIFAVSVVIIIFHKRINEVKDELDLQKLEQKRLSEKLKIHERLAKIEERIFKNG